MKKFLLIAWLVCGSLAHAVEIPAIVAFGDSLSDMGNRWIKSPEETSKIRSTWVRQLAGPSLLNIQGFTVSGRSAYLGGTNYAVGGATTEFMAKSGPARNRGENLTEQISRRYLNPAFNKDGVKKEALHAIVIGTNDLMLASVGLDQIGTQWIGLDKVGVEVARSTESQIKALAEAGITRVLWGNLFDTAQAPSVVNKAKLLGGSLAPAYFAALTKATKAHNEELDAAIERLHMAHAGLKIAKLDLFGKFAEVAANPGKYGFASVTVGANDSKHLFSADGLHPTPQGHKMLAEYAYSVIAAEYGGASAGKAAEAVAAK